MKTLKPEPYTNEEDKALSLEQYLKYAADFAELYERELNKSKSLEAANKELEREITMRKKLEKQLIKSEKKYRSLFEDSRDPIVMSSCAGRVVQANEAFREMLGYTEEEIVPKSMLDIYADPTIRGLVQREVESKGFVKDFEIQLVKKDGTIIDCLATASLRFSVEGKLLGYQAILRDVTEQKRIEQLRQQAKRMEALASLAGNVAHQIRNALAISSSAVQLLMTNELHPLLKKECSGKVMSGIKRAVLIIENLLAYVWSVQKSEMTTVQVVSLVQEALALVREDAVNQNVEMNCTFETEGLYVKANPQLLLRALVNLLTISLSFMRDGGIAKISATRNGSEALVTISNTGQGFQRKLADEGLDPFSSDVTNVNDLELALSVSHAIIAQHEGRIGVKSGDGQGMAYEVVLPALHSY